MTSRQEDYKEAALKEGEVVTLGDYAHIYENPDMYLDSLIKTSQTVWTLGSDLKPRRAYIHVALGLIQLFSEVLANACDAMERTIRNGFKPGPVEITFENPYITIRNEGFPILVQQDENGVWLPEKVVTTPRTGSNFGGHRHGGGKNGYGLTLLLCFCDYLRMVVYDSVNGKSYSQEFHGPENVGDPDIDDYDEDRSFVEVTFKPGFKYFKYPPEVDYYPEHIEDFYRSLGAVASLACKTPVIFNEVEMDYTSIVDYSNIFFDAELKRKLHYIWPKKTKVITRKDGSQYAEDGLTLPLVELVIVDSNLDTDKSKVKQFGITNSVLNQEGGIHVDAVFEQLTKPLVTHINGDHKKGDEKDKTDLKNFFRVNASHLKAHISVIISVHVMNPLFNGQTKTALKSYAEPKNLDNQINEMKLRIPESLIEEIIEEFECVRILKETVKANLMKPLADLDGKKTKNCGTLNFGDDAEWAGTSKSEKCILFIFEGKSAGAYAKQFRAQSSNGINYIGLLPTGGKIKNISEITEETVSKLANNKFFQDYKKMMGIKEGVDYTNLKNRSQLRYGCILYAGDADVDGIHICALFLNMNNVLYPSILEAGIISTYRTKVLSAIPKGRGKKTKKEVFYELAAYKEWAKTVDIEKYNVKYFKGLGSSNKEDCIEDYKTMFIVCSVYDEAANESICTFFEKKEERAAERRDLITAYDADSVPPPIEETEDGIKYENISTYLHHSYITYCAATLVRHLSGRDGLNEVRRKVIHAATEQWNWWKAANATEKSIRVAVFNGAAIQCTNYHHGNSLTGVIIRMAQDFVGSNNVPYFIGDGQFGTREDGGNDGADARYISIFPNIWWLKLIYDVRDKPLLEYQKDEGESVEPKFYLPPLPMTLVQGQDAVMSGWRAYIPPYNVLDLCYWYLAYMEGEELPELVPFWRGFHGRVQVVDSRKEKETEEDLIDDEGEVVIDDDGNKQKIYVTTVQGKYSVRTHGIVTDLDANCLTITELPVGVWTTTFLEGTVPKMIKSGRIKNARRIEGYTPERPVIRVEGIAPKDAKNNPHRKINISDFPLSRSYPLGSMWILGEDNKPVHFESVTDILIDFYEWRIPFYEQRRQMEMEKARQGAIDAKDKMAYVTAVVEKRLKIIKRKKADILADVRELGLREDLYGFTKYYDQETIAALDKQAALAEAEYARISAMTAEMIFRDKLDEIIEAYTDVYGDDRK